MALSKKTRFEIFKRDGFTCQYCGRRPPDVVLEVDHIEPRSNGGLDDLLNLISSCFDCNRGKGPRVLKDRIVRPDADVQYPESQQEIAEARRFLEARENLEELRPILIGEIQHEWLSLVNGNEMPSDQTVLLWLSKYSPEEIITAISILGTVVVRDPWKFGNMGKMIRYAGGIMRGRREDRLV